MPETKNLCAQVPIELHERVNAEKEQANQTTSQYITNLITEYYKMIEIGGVSSMTGKERTMAFQISEELFQRIKRYLERESDRLGRRVTQREFVLDLIEEALAKAEAGESLAQEDEDSDEQGAETESTPQDGDDETESFQAE